MMLKLIWDLDGTLIDSKQEILEALIKSVHKAGLAEKDMKNPFKIGPTIDTILDISFPIDILTPDKKSLIIKNFRSNYDNCGFKKTFPFDGIEEILKNKNYQHYIVTNKPDLVTHRILKRLNWRKYFLEVITPYSFIEKTNDSKKKTKTELFHYCISKNVDSRFIGIGDMETDAIAALNNSISAIGVLWGTGTEQELIDCKCTYITKTVNELNNLLKILLKEGDKR